MATIPVICGTCKFVWFSDSIFGEFEQGARIPVIGCEAGPCPKCGSYGAIPDGIYEQTRMTLLNTHQYEAVVTALAAIKVMLDTNVEPAEIARAIDDEYPVLAHLKEFIPKDIKDLAIVVGILLAITNSCKDDAQNNRPSTALHAQSEIVEVLRDISSRLKKAPPEIPEQQPQ